MAKLAQNWLFWPNIGIFGPFGLIPDWQTMRTSCLGGYSVTWVPKLLLPPKRIRFFGPKFLSPHSICHFKVFKVFIAVDMGSTQPPWRMQQKFDESELQIYQSPLVMNQTLAGSVIILFAASCLPCSVFPAAYQSCPGQKLFGRQNWGEADLRKNSPEHVNIIGLLVFGLGGKHSS